MCLANEQTPQASETNLSPKSVSFPAEQREGNDMVGNGTEGNDMENEEGTAPIVSLAFRLDR